MGSRAGKLERNKQDGAGLLYRPAIHKMRRESIKQLVFQRVSVAGCRGAARLIMGMSPANLAFTHRFS